MGKYTRIITLLVAICMMMASVSLAETCGIGEAASHEPDAAPAAVSPAVKEKNEETLAGAAASTSSGCTVISGSEARLTVAASEVTVIPLEETRHRYILPSILAFIRKLNSKVLYPPEVQFFHVLPSVLYCHW